MRQLLALSFICLASVIYGDALGDMDAFFVKQYQKISEQSANAIRPVILVDGFNYTLYNKDGTTEIIEGPVPPFNALKAVSHIGPCLYAIGKQAWTGDSTWIETLKEYQKLVAEAKKSAAEVDWSNPEWVMEEYKLRRFMIDSISAAEKFIALRLKEQRFDKQHYIQFAQNYLPTMVITMFLANLADTTDALNKLKDWKKKLGAQWEDLYVVLYGSKGRSTAALTVDTNTAAQTIASLMDPKKVETNILLAPTSKNPEQAFATLGAVLNARELANLTFDTNREQKISGLYKALQNPTIPLALDNVKEIIQQYKNHNPEHYSY